MRIRPCRVLLAIGLVAGLSACADTPTLPPLSDPAFAKGGNKPGAGNGGAATGDIVDLGEAIFHDQNLSVNTNESCSTCHEPAAGFAAPLAGATTQGSVVQGSEAGRFGDRKPPTATYATLVPIFNGSGQGATGGNFWDGRATGELLGNPAADQALGPFLNPNEQGMPDKACVIWRIANSAYVATWVKVWGDAITQIEFPSNVGTVCTTWYSQPGEYVVLNPDDRTTVNQAYDNVALSIQAFETTINKFSSKVDQGQLTDLELAGQQLFSTKGKCHQCHDTRGSQPVFTDFQFHNIGAPRNPDHPLYPYGVADFDPGLGGFTGLAADLGKFKTPTVRNVAAGGEWSEGGVRTYLHNGSLVNLWQVVEFYNTRDVLPTCTGDVLNHPVEWGPGPDHAGCWPPAEYPQNMDTKQMGNLGLTADEVNAIVAYLKAMTDQ